MTAVDLFARPNAKSGVTWTAGVAVSAGLHLAMAALVVVLIRPLPVVDQPMPTSHLTIETEAVAQTKAKAAAGQTTAAATTSAKGAAVAETVVAHSVAKAAAPGSQIVAAQPPEGQKLAALTAPSVPAPVTASADAVSPATAVSQQVSAASPAETPLQAKDATLTGSVVSAATIGIPVQAATAVAPMAAAAPIEPVAQHVTASPTAQSLTPSAPTGAKALPVRATSSAQTVTSAAPTGATNLSAAAAPAVVAAPSHQSPDTVVAAAAVGQQMTATLAWVGRDARLDPQSLKAIQSFMQPLGNQSRSDETHDALASILSSVPCARLQVAFDPATGSLDLRGHVPDPALRAPILKALQDQIGTGIPVRDAMLILPRPQCGALAGIADLGLPQSQDQITDARLIGPDAQTRSYAYTKGQSMVLDLSAPDYAAYLYVDFFAADGSVIHLIPNATVPLRKLAAKARMQVGAPDGAAPYLKIKVTAPYGQEIAAAFASSTPLYDGLRPMHEPAEAYLAWLKTRVSQARAADPKFKGEWVYFFVATAEQ